MNTPSTLLAPDTVRLERLLPGPVERVWAYITESDKRAQWLAAGKFDLRVGGQVQLDFDNSSLPNDSDTPEKYRNLGKHQFTGVITRLEPMRLLAHTWKWDNSDTEVTYELAPRGKDVLLTIVHKRLTPRELVMSVMGGWDTHTGILEDILKGVKPRSFWTTHARLEMQYGAAA